MSSLVLACCVALVSCWAGEVQENRTTAAQQLFNQERWQEVVSLLETTPKHSAELTYYYGLSLAHLERLDEAHRVLLTGSRMDPSDKRFPIELAGIAFKKKNYRQTIAYLHLALALDSRDSYSNEFLATVYFLEGNLEAAVKYWNRVGKPKIEDVRIDPLPRVSPILLDHAFAFSPTSELRLLDLLATEARVEGLGIFPSYRFDLSARPDGKFDILFQAQERSGWGSSKFEALLRVSKGIPYQEIEPQYFNLRASAVNIASLFRWDAQKRRFLASVSGPFGRDPRWHYRFGVDSRNENWEIRESVAGLSLPFGALNLRTQVLDGEITRFVGGAWRWSTGLQVSHRDYRNVLPEAALTPLLVEGYELKETAQLDHTLLRIPEKRFTLTSGISSQVGRIWSSPAQSFTKAQASLESHWFPQTRGDDYETRWRIRAGKTLGQIPFDELFMLGLERDNDLWLRAHIGTRNGRKGSAPLGRDYFLSNWETDKNVYQNGVFTVKVGPFLDVGKILDSSTALGSRKWLWDTGVEAKFYVLGVGIALSYGRDLRSGRAAFYTGFAP